MLPEGVIVVDESITSGRGLMRRRRVRRITTGWSTPRLHRIGMRSRSAPPVACPDRRAVPEANGSGMYTLQARWTPRARV